MEPIYIDPRLKWCEEHLDEIKKHHPAFLAITASGILLSFKTDRFMDEACKMLEEDTRQAVMIVHTSQFV